LVAGSRNANRIAGGIDSLVELLQGRLSKGVMERICRQGSGLFPKPAEIRFSCSCLDHASMCKHVAAALYGVGARLDAQPELLFRLCAVDEKELVARVDATLPAAKPAPAPDKVLDADDLSALFGLEMDANETAIAMADNVRPAQQKLIRAKKPAKSKGNFKSSDPPRGPREEEYWIVRAERYQESTGTESHAAKVTSHGQGKQNCPKGGGQGRVKASAAQGSPSYRGSARLRPLRYLISSPRAQQWITVAVQPVLSHSDCLTGPTTVILLQRGGTPGRLVPLVRGAAAV
jgi:hypothetical protein